MSVQSATELHSVVKGAIYGDLLKISVYLEKLTVT